MILVSFGALFFGPNAPTESPGRPPPFSRPFGSARRGGWSGVISRLSGIWAPKTIKSPCTLHLEPQKSGKLNPNLGVYG